jgi:hypothetical protein
MHIPMPYHIQPSGRHPASCDDSLHLASHTALLGLMPRSFPAPASSARLWRDGILVLWPCSSGPTHLACMMHMINLINAMYARSMHTLPPCIYLCRTTYSHLAGTGPQPYAGAHLHPALPAALCRRAHAELHSSDNNLHSVLLLSPFNRPTFSVNATQCITQRCDGWKVEACMWCCVQEPGGTAPLLAFYARQKR